MMLKRYLARSPSHPSRSAMNTCEVAAVVVEGRGYESVDGGTSMQGLQKRGRREQDGQLHLVAVVIVQMFQ